MKRILKNKNQHLKLLQIKDLNHLDKKTFKKIKRKQKTKNIPNNILRSQSKKKFRINTTPMKWKTATTVNLKKKTTKMISCLLSFDQSSQANHKTNVTNMLRMTTLMTQVRCPNPAVIT